VAWSKPKTFFEPSERKDERSGSLALLTIREHLQHAGFAPRNVFAFENMGKGWRGKPAERIDAALAAL
jgi:hypothetical protein